MSWSKTSCVFFSSKMLNGIASINTGKIFSYGQFKYRVCTLQSVELVGDARQSDCRYFFSIAVKQDLDAH